MHRPDLYIIEQCIEWNTPLHINFIDFNRVHHNTLWKIMLSYGVPPEMVMLMRLFHRKFECSIIVDGYLSVWFPVKSGVQQACIISPILFLVTIDWIMRKTTADRPRGIQWTPFSQLEDHDFANDLAVFSTKFKHLQEKKTTD